MTGFTVGALLLVASCVLALPVHVGHGSPGGAATRGSGSWLAGLRSTGRFGSPRRVQGISPVELPLFVHQLSALLQAGRSPHQLWQDMAAVCAAGVLGGSQGKTKGFARQALPVLRAAHQAAAIGAGVPDVLRRAAQAPCRRLAWGPGRARTPPVDCAGLWRDLAACLEISERSGAPLAGVLNRYASQLEQSLDSAAARETALAGPLATARLLGWLPVVGLGLGYLAGAQPLSILVGSTAGLVLLCIGVALTVMGRCWSAKLVAAATKVS